MDNAEFAARIAALNLEGIAITAGIEPDGELAPVAAGFDKMLAAAQMRSLPRVHTILAHPAANLPELAAGPAETLRSLSARTLDEAVTLLLTEQNTRWGAIPEYGSIFRQHRNLVGRGWLRQKVSAAVELALTDPSAPPYILITGGPGTGKTAFVADQVSPSKDRGAVYHFIRRGLGQDDPDRMLASLAAQLLRVHALPAWNGEKAALPAAVFAQTLERLAASLHEGERQLIWIDGLDEAFGPLGAYHGAALDRLLPLDGLPPGVILVMTSRGDGPLDWLDDVQRFHRIDLDQNRQANLADIREYLGRQSRDLDLNLESGLLDQLAQASEGCFMAAVRYLNPAGNRAALEARIAEWRLRPYNIPTGLEGWLQRQWSILLASANQAGIDRRVVYAAMGVAAHEAGLRTGAGSTASVASAIKATARFLTTQEIASLETTMEGVTRLAGEFFEIESGPGGQVWYRFFHSRFAEFVREKVEQEAERIGNRPVQPAPPAPVPKEELPALPRPAAGGERRAPPNGAAAPAGRPAQKTAPQPESAERPQQAAGRWWLRPQGLALAALAVVFIAALAIAVVSALRGEAGAGFLTNPSPTLAAAAPSELAVVAETEAPAALTQAPVLPPTRTAAPPSTQTPAPSPTSIEQSVFQVQACMTAELDANNRVQECVTTLTRLPDGRLRLDITWQAALQANASVNLSPALETGGMYLSDDLGSRYDPIETGGVAAQTTRLTGSQSATGWFIFNAPAAQARRLVFHDDDNGIQTGQFELPWTAP